MIQTFGLTKIYSTTDSKITALDDVCFSVSKGAFAAIVGSSGSGKSTLLNTLGLLDKPDSGSYLLDGKDVLKINDKKLAHIRRDLLGFVFQNYNLIPRLTALENVELGLIFKGIPPKKRKSIARETLCAVGLENRINHYPSEMSGGQQQRVAIARAIAGEPKLILADEPTGNLDAESASSVMDILRKQNKFGVTILLITHSAEVAGYASSVYRMKNGRLTPEDKTINEGIETNEKR